MPMMTHGYVPKGVASKDVGVGLLQDVKSVDTQPSTKTATAATVPGPV